MDAQSRWGHHQSLASGQVAEFKVWAELARQSMGGLHVFLPVRDLGIAGVMHRLGDGAYIPGAAGKKQTWISPSGPSGHLPRGAGK